MARRSVFLCAVGCALLVDAVPFASARAEDKSGVGDAAAGLPPEAAIRQTLDSRPALPTKETPLRELAKQLAQLAGVSVRIDGRALEDAGISSDQSVVVPVAGLTLRSSLELALRSSGLTFTIADETLLITTSDGAASRLVTRVYAAGDFLSKPSDSVHANFCGKGRRDARRTVSVVREADLSELIGCLTTAVQPDAWSATGGPGSIEQTGQALVVTQTEALHELVGPLLTALRSARDTQQQTPGGEPIVVTRSAEAEFSRLATGRLKQRISLTFDQRPLSEALTDFSKLSGLPVVADQRAFEDAGIGLDMPVDLRVRDISARAALTQLLESAGLRFLIAHEVLWITTPDGAAAERSVVVYPIGDFADVGGVGRGSESVIDVITSSISPAAWDDHGGPGAVVWFSNSNALVVAQTPAIPDQIAPLLADLRANGGNRGAEPGLPRVQLDVYLLNGVSVKDRAAAAAELQKTIPRHVAEPSWQRPEASIDAVAGRLFVRQTSDVQRQIERWLRAGDFIGPSVER